MSVKTDWIFRFKTGVQKSLHFIHLTRVRSLGFGAFLGFGVWSLGFGTAFAEDSFGPCWRSNPGTTFQNWTFAVSNNPAAPDAFTNPDGTPQATLAPGAFATGWQASSLGGRTGVWDFGQAGHATLAIPNYGGSLAWKYLQIQITYFDAAGFYLPPTIVIPGATLISSAVTNNQTVTPGAWRTLQNLWLLQPSPASETITLNGDLAKGLLIDQIIVDTRCPTAGDGDVPAFRPCWRGQPGSTFQQWMFGVSNNPASIPAEFVTNSFGAPRATVVAGPSSSGFIQENAALGCRQGIWDLGKSGTMTLAISNAPGSADSYKYVRVQVTQLRDTTRNTNATVSVSGGALMSQQQQSIETNASGGQWIVAQSIWRLGPPCPAFEPIVLTAGTNGSYIDQVVVDTVCLDFACPTNIVAVADAGHCTKSNVTLSLPAVNGCTFTNITSTPTNGSTFPVGTNQVTSVIQDGEGFSKTCNFSVKITDAEPPSPHCKNITVYLNAFGLASITGSDIDDGSTDNCGIASLSVNSNSFNCSNLGSNGVTLTVTDVNGNSATCNAVVTVQDTLPPSISCPADIVHTNDFGQCGAVITYIAPVGTDNCPGAVTTQIAGLASGSFFSVGKTTNTFKVTDASSNSAQCSFVVTVNDAQPPQIACPSDISTTNDPGQCGAVVTFTPPVGTDNCPGTVTAQIAGLVGGSFFPIGKTTNTFKVTDASSNSAQCSFVVTVNDTEPPQISCPSDITITANTNPCSAVATYTAPIGTDNCPGAVTTQIAGLPSGSVFPLGATTNTFKVTDAANNTTQCSFVVTVTPAADLLVTITASPNPVLVGTNFTYTITVSNQGPCTATAAVLTNSLSAGQTASSASFPLGNLTNSASAQITVTTAATNCPTVSATATVTSSTTDPNLANNTATASVTVNDLPSGQLVLSVELLTNNFLRLCWPLTCTPSILEATDDLNPPVTWNPAGAPIAFTNNQDCALVPIASEKRFFRLRVP